MSAYRAQSSLFASLLPNGNPSPWRWLTLLVDVHQSRRKSFAAGVCLLCTGLAICMFWSLRPTAWSDHRGKDYDVQTLFSFGDRSCELCGTAKPFSEVETQSPYSSSWNNTIALCAIMKDERPEDMLEWLDYHRHVGVDKVFLRENDNSTKLLRYLEPYIKEGFVDYGFKIGPKHPTQTNWFNECGSYARGVFSWMAFVDTDEFIVVLKNQQSVPAAGSLKAILKDRFRFTGAVSLQWVLFGSGGHIRKPAAGQLAGFNRCTGVLSKQMKCIGNLHWTFPDVIFGPLKVHQCALQPGVPAVLGNGMPLILQEVDLETPAQAVSYHGHLSTSDIPFHSIITDDYSLVLFHYVTRSFEEFLNRKIKNRSGVYASEFRDVLSGDNSSAVASAVEKFKEFEARHSFDGNAPICHQGRTISAAFKHNHHGTPELSEPEEAVPFDVAEAQVMDWAPSCVIANHPTMRAMGDGSPVAAVMSGV